MNAILFAQEAAGNSVPGILQQMGMLPMFILLILVMYFLMIRPQSKKQKEKQNMLAELKAGDEVMTIGGIYGKIEGVREKDDILILRIGKDQKIHVARSSVASKTDKKVIA